jgi:hypothetical protein
MEPSKLAISKEPKNFSWKLKKVEPNNIPGSAQLQQQCSSGGGGNGKCGGK